MNKIFESREELLKTAKESLNIPFGKLDKTNRLVSAKGGVGQMVEENVFEYSANSESQPDFPNLGIELKVSPMVKRKDGTYKAKERMVLNIINYMTENLDSFYDSHLWYKNKEILMMFYEHNYNLPKQSWFLQEILDYTWPEKDLEIVKNDWKIITDKIKKGKAHELSESDTMYLGACTKGANAESSYRNQPYSDIKAKQRAYSLKQSYVNYILAHYVFNKENDEPLIKDEAVLKDKSFFNVILDMIKPYVGKTQKELVSLFEIKESKQTNASIVKKIFKINGDISKTEEFLKANIIPKTIRIESNGTIREHMSFPTFRFKEIINQTFEESDFGNILLTGKFMFIIFQKVDDTEENSIFKGVVFWSMPYEDIIEARKCWENTKQKIINGIKFIPTSRGYENDFPSTKDNMVSHVRPHASKSYYKFENGVEKGNPSDGDELPDGRWMTKQCFWLNRGYIKSVLQKEGIIKDE